MSHLLLLLSVLLVQADTAGATSDADWWQGVAKTIVTTQFVFIYSLLIVLFASSLFFPLRRRSRKLSKQLREANRLIAKTGDEQAFARSFETISQQMTKMPLLRHAWSEFTESLLDPQVGSRQVKRNTREASYYFNDDSLIFPHIDLRFYGSVPNILTGMGIFGTFLGLAAGIYLMQIEVTATGAPTKVIVGLQHLLRGASLAFVTSLFGIGSSLLFLFLERKYVSMIHGEISRLTEGLDSRLELLTPEKLAELQLVELRQQSKVLQDFSNDLAVSLGTVLEQKFAERLTPGLERLIAAMEGVRQDRGETNTQILEKMVDDFKQAMTGSVSNELQSMAGTLEALNTQLHSSVESVRQNQVHLQEATTKVAESVKNAITSASEAMLARVNESLDSITTRLASAGTTAAQGVEKSFTSFNQGMARLEESTRALTDLGGGMRSTVEKLTGLAQTMAEAQSRFQGVVEPIRAGLDALKATSDQSRATLKGATELSRHLEATSEATKNLQAQMAQSWESYRTRFEGVDSSLQKVFQELDNGLTNYTDRVRRFMLEMEGNVTKISTILSSAIVELSESIEELSEKTGQSAG